MSRRKRNTSKVLDVAQQRALSLEIIDPELDLGRDVSLEEYRQNIQDLQDTLNRYNQDLLGTLTTKSQGSPWSLSTTGHWNTYLEELQTP